MKLPSLRKNLLAEVTLKSGAKVRFRCVNLNVANSRITWTQGKRLSKRLMHMEFEEIAAIVVIR